MTHKEKCPNYPFEPVTDAQEKAPKFKNVRIFRACGTQGKTPKFSVHACGAQDAKLSIRPCNAQGRSPRFSIRVCGAQLKTPKFSIRACNAQGELSLHACGTQSRRIFFANGTTFCVKIFHFAPVTHKEKCPNFLFAPVTRKKKRQNLKTLEFFAPPAHKTPDFPFAPTTRKEKHQNLPFAPAASREKRHFQKYRRCET